MLREFGRSLKTCSMFSAFLMLFLCCTVLSGCGGEETEKGAETKTEAEKEKATAEPAKYGDIVSKTKFVFDSPKEPETFLGVQYYQGETVQLLAGEDGSLYLLKEDMSREVLIEGAEGLADMSCFLDMDGNCYCWERDFTGQSVSIRKLDADRGELYSARVGDGMRVSDICQLEDGRIFLLLENSGTGNVSLSELNPATGVLSKITDISLSSNSMNAVRYIAAGSEGILVIEAGTTEKITQVSLSDGTREDVLSFVGTSYNLSRNKKEAGNMTARDFRVTEDGSVELLWADERGICMRESLSMSLTDKTAILVWVGYEDSWLKDKAFQFNQENPDYHVVLDSPGTGDETAHMEMAKIEVARGKGPDILTGYLLNNLKSMTEEGIFEDLVPYMEASGTSEEDYFPAAFNYIRDNEKIYTVVTEITVAAGWLSEDILTDEGLPDIEELVDALLGWQGSYEYSTGVSYIILEGLLRGSEDFWGMIDWEHGTCNFNCELFSKMLGAAGRHGCTRAYLLDMWRSFGLTEESWMTGNLLCDTIFYFDSRDELAAQGKVMGGTLFDDGWHAALYGDRAYAINANSLVKEGAWEFLRFLLEERNQEDVTQLYKQPVNRAAFMVKLKEDLEIVEGGRIYHVHNEQSTPSGEEYVWKDMDYTREDMTDERIAEYIEVLESARYLPWKTEVLLDIIKEEAEYYFEGVKSIEEVIDIINNRVNLYLSEHR